MNSRILNLDAFTETFVWFRIILMYKIVTLTIKSTESTFTSCCRFIAGLIVHRLPRSIPIITKIAAKYRF